VNCESAQTAVHGYFDGELDAVRALEFERHLKACSECQAALKGLESLHTGLQQGGLYEHASPQLERRIREQLSLTGGTDSFRRSVRSWFLMPAFAVLAMVFVFWVALRLVQPHTESARVTAELIDAHVRSLQPGHLMAVQSTDQHTVKPWFDGKLDFVPPVGDYSQQGFPLVGGRLDVVDGHNIAALVYGRRKHFINLFAWPNDKRVIANDGTGSRGGYNWVSWTSGDMHLCLVSDASTSDLQELKELIHP
jgi:anti-sigma factor RsiW